MIKRDNLVDFLRAIAIVLMVFAHTRMILNLELKPHNELIQNIGNTICFIIFLACFGASNYYSSLRSKLGFKNSLKKVYDLYLAYLVICIVNLINAKSLSLNLFLEHALFIKLPAYGEFLVSFIFYQLLFFNFPKIFLYFSSNFVRFLSFSAIFFVTGCFFSRFNLGIFNPIGLILFGKEKGFSFPLFQYITFFIFGIYYAIKVCSYKQLKIIKNIIYPTILLGIYFFFLQTKYSITFNNFKRWPPDLNFIIFGFFSIFILALCFKLLIFTLKKYIQNLNNVLFILSCYSLHILYVHIAILFALTWTKPSKSYIINYISAAAILALFYILFYTKKYIKKDEK